MGNELFYKSIITFIIYLLIYKILKYLKDDINNKILLVVFDIINVYAILNIIGIPILLVIIILKGE
jgi:hypothetical protein